jgi:hypothetical protein
MVIYSISVEWNHKTITGEKERCRTLSWRRRQVAICMKNRYRTEDVEDKNQLNDDRDLYDGEPNATPKAQSAPAIICGET